MDSDAALPGRVSTILRSTGFAEVPAVVAVRGSDGTRLIDGWEAGGIHGDVTGTSVMYGASLAKQIVGVLAAALVDAGELDTAAPLRRFAPDLPGWADGVRVRHLLHHTSGLPGAVASLSTSTTWDNAGVMAALRRSDRLDNPPGTVFAYSNAGYICLAEVIGIVASEPLGEVANELLFAPLGMTRTEFGPMPASAHPGHQEPPRSVGDGGLWTTAEDLLRWNDAMNERYLGDAIHERAETPGSLDDGTPLDYAWGVRIFRRGDQTTIAHGGHWPSWTAETVRQPRRGVSVAILSCSNDSERVSEVAVLVADRL